MTGHTFCTIDIIDANHMQCSRVTELTVVINYSASQLIWLIWSRMENSLTFLATMTRYIKCVTLPGCTAHVKAKRNGILFVTSPFHVTTKLLKNVITAWVVESWVLWGNKLLNNYRGLHKILDYSMITLSQPDLRSFNHTCAEQSSATYSRILFRFIFPIRPLWFC